MIMYAYMYTYGLPKLRLCVGFATDTASIYRTAKVYVAWRPRHAIRMDSERHSLELPSGLTARACAVTWWGWIDGDSWALSNAHCSNCLGRFPSWICMMAMISQGLT